ncbi:MAG: acetolactate synthase, partial [Candidatus Altiarchaeota archaeon]|nr:acetolactate synthase [Candidatus Altiarchaeota archaeon]
MIKQISVFLENNPGSLYRVVDALAKSDVDIRALSISENSDFALFRFIVNDPEGAVRVLADSGIAAVSQDVIAVEVDDKPGGLALIAGILSKNNVNIEYIYPLIARKHKNAFIIIRTDDIEKTEKVMLRNKLHILDKKEF